MLGIDAADERRLSQELRTPNTLVLGRHFSEKRRCLVSQDDFHYDGPLLHFVPRTTYICIQSNVPHFPCMYPAQSSYST